MNADIVTLRNVYRYHLNDSIRDLNLQDDIAVCPFVAIERHIGSTQTLELLVGQVRTGTVAGPPSRFHLHASVMQRAEAPRSWLIIARRHYRRQRQ